MRNNVFFALELLYYIVRIIDTTLDSLEWKFRTLYQQQAVTVDILSFRSNTEFMGHSRKTLKWIYFYCSKIVTTQFNVSLPCQTIFSRDTFFLLHSASFLTAKT